jgi:hypothetical protein
MEVSQEVKFVLVDPKKVELGQRHVKIKRYSIS